MSFTTDFEEILDQVELIDPVAYGKTRNFIDGAVTRLSPYISRGVISTKYVLHRTLERGFHPAKIEKFIQELAWRDYWQQNWIAKGNDINRDLRRIQSPVSNHGMPTSVLDADTGVEGIDNGIQELYETGYMHNHVRMYTSAVVCNMAYSHWLVPAKWMYFHLLDGDWASNALSWQWTAGANANKKYVANQENVNKYCRTNQWKTFLNVDYGVFQFPSYECKPNKALSPSENDFKTPQELLQTSLPELSTDLPESTISSLDTSKPTYIYNWYNLDPQWAMEEDANRVLLLEPSVFDSYPISDKSVQFMLDLARNIKGIQVFTGEFSELVNTYGLKDIHYKEHPLNTNYKGTEHSRDWMFSVSGYHSSFFGFWKKANKQLRY